jgi:hypothetical protein
MGFDAERAIREEQEETIKELKATVSMATAELKAAYAELEHLRKLNQDYFERIQRLVERE